MAFIKDIRVDSIMIDEFSELAWLSKSLAAGLLHGMHRSKNLSSGIEFSQYRPYVPGDDPRLIDLKMVAKTDRYYVKQAQIESRQIFQFLIDNSASMDYEEKGLSKLHLAKLIVATLSYVANMQGDKYGWNSTDESLNIDTGMNHWRRCISSLSEVKIESEHTPSSVFSIRKGIVIWITDLYESLESIKAKMNEWSSPHLEAIIIHLAGKKEENLDFKSNSNFIDLESNVRIETHIPSVLKTYQKNYRSHFRAIKEMADERGIVYFKIYLDDHLPATLKTFFDMYNSTRA